jgi:hypothetical protein
MTLFLFDKLSVAAERSEAAPCSPCLGGDDLRKTNPMCDRMKLGKEDVHEPLMSGNLVDAQRVQLPRGKGSPPAASESCGVCPSIVGGIAMLRCDSSTST